MTTHRDQFDDLAPWERWPLAALFLANAMNIFILYVPMDEMPLAIQGLLPWVRVACGIAAAASLEGTLIAVTMGRRLGRDSKWSWATMFAASAFTAAVAWYVHGELGAAAAGLFMAQAVVLFIYAQHLAQPRKALQPPPPTVRDRLQSPILAKKALTSADRATVALPAKFECKICGAPFEALTDVSAHHRSEHPKSAVNRAD